LSFLAIMLEKDLVVFKKIQIYMMVKEAGIGIKK
jgi:hypothetical protein